MYRHMSIVFILAFAGSTFAQPPSLQVPTYIAVVFDGSGSMGAPFGADRGRTRMEIARETLISVLGKVPSNTQVGIIVFSGNRNGWIYEIGPVDQAQLAGAVNSVFAGGGTPLGHYMKEAADALLRIREQKKVGNYKLVIVTDGESTDNIEIPLSGPFGILSKGLQVEAIGIDMRQNHSLATKVSYRNAANPDELVRAVSAVVAESGTTKDFSEDYATIAALDEKLCKEVLKALSDPDNAPIGMQTKFDDVGNPVRDQTGNPVVVAKNGPPPAPPPTGRGWGFWSIVAAVLVVIVVGVVIRKSS